MDWTNKNVAPSKVVTLGDEVEVMVLEIDEDKRRISLGMKQCKANPWEEFAPTCKRGDKVKGPDQVDHRLRRVRRPGLPPASTAWCTCPTCPGTSRAKPPCATTRRARKSRPWCWPSTSSASASLGIKQLDSDPFTTFTTVNDRGMTVTGKVKTVDARGAEIQTSTTT